nr:MAG TPA: hypothetical protein [Caudoviricetes sp.]
MYNEKTNTWLLIGMDLEFKDENITVLDENHIKYE